GPRRTARAHVRLRRHRRAPGGPLPADGGSADRLSRRRPRRALAWDRARCAAAPARRAPLRARRGGGRRQRLLDAAGALARRCANPGSGGARPARVLPRAADARGAGLRVLLCAPTGKAARRMRDLSGHDAMTIHRALGYSPQEDRFLRDEDDPLSNDVELVIVDEASMLSLQLADALFRAVGDCHVLLVGDTDQLPPIGPGRVLADLVESKAAPRVHLTAIYRQAARSLIVRSARRINEGRPPFLSLAEAHAELGEQELDEDFFWISRSGPETLREAVLELVCEALPRRGFDPRTEVMTLV